MNIIGVLALALGAYLVYRSDQETKNGVAKAFFLVAGLVTIAWSLPILSSGVSIRAGSPLLAFALFSSATVKTKGGVQILSGILAILIVLAVIV